MELANTLPFQGGDSGFNPRCQYQPPQAFSVEAMSFVIQQKWEESMDFSVKLPLADNRNAEQYRYCTLICGDTSGLVTHYNKIQAKQTENYFFGGLIVMKVLKNLQSEDTPIG